MPSSLGQDSTATQTLPHPTQALTTHTGLQPPSLPVCYYPTSCASPQDPLLPLCSDTWFQAATTTPSPVHIYLAWPHLMAFGLNYSEREREQYSHAWLIQGECAEKCIDRSFQCCANIIACTYVNLDCIAYYTPVFFTS